MTVLAIIPCLNEAVNIERITRQLLSDKAVDAIVIADGGSTDGTLKIVESLTTEAEKVSLLNNPAKIQSSGINAAVESKGLGMTWLLRIDAHCAYPDNYATCLLDSANRMGADSVVVPMKTVGHTGFQLAVATAQNSVLGTGGSAHRGQSEGQWVEHGHHALMRMEKFIDVGGYCEAMPCNEDAELDYRLTLAGSRIWLEPDATILYFPRATPKRLWIQYYKYGIGRACNLQRHRMKPRLRQLVPLAVPCAAILLMLSPFHWVFAIPFLSWLGLCLGLGAFIGARRGKAVALLSGGAAAIMHFAWATGFFKQLIFRPKGVDARYGILTKPSLN